MTYEPDSAATPLREDSLVTISPANTDRSIIDSNVHLKNLATGDTLRKTLGAVYPQLAWQLCASPDTLQSVTRSWMASIEGEVVGQISAIASSEYAARQRASKQLIWRASRRAGMRIYIDSVRRWLSQTPLGPWASGQLYIESLAVAESARRRGVGARLLNHVQIIANAQSCNALCLNALTTNTAAVSLYEANGFHIASRKGHSIKLLKVLA